MWSYLVLLGRMFEAVRSELTQARIFLGTFSQKCLIMLKNLVFCLQTLNRNIKLVCRGHLTKKC